MEADAAREQFQRIRARFAQPPPALQFEGATVIHHQGREVEIVARQNLPRVLEWLKTFSPESLKTEALSLEEIFVAALKPEGGAL
jgi:hypothetical protein